MKMVSAFDFLLSLLLLRIGFAMAQDYTEPYRPQYHFTPPKNWMNDPNGLLYHEGVYHLFFQHNPNGITWGNMSWGHATSSDLVHWENQALALEARTNVTGGLTEMFFSGSAVADVNNTSGFGIDGNTPLVAVYTSLYPQAQDLPSGKSVKAGQQSQSIAYSLDQGYTWTTYDAGNPVILEPPSPYQSSDNLNNFRDPFVFWHNLSQKWIMVVSLANEHKILVYTSTSLREWAYTSEFGPVNAVGGQWECPSLFSLPIDRNTTATKWVLQIGLNPGGPSIGSGTQYIIGRFDGQSFVADPESVYDPPSTPPGSTILEDFEAATWSALGWNATGDFANTGPVEGAFSNQQKVSGYYGDRLVNTFFDGDNSTGKIISPIFNITKGYINFLVGGGYNPHDKLTYGTAADTATSINLLLNGEVVRSATGRNGEALVWDGWNVESYIGSPAQIEIVDFSTEGFGHINVDQIVFSESLALEQKANWVDWGPDYYAAVVYNGLPDGEHMSIGWMNNWAYGGDIPTYPWRSTMSIPRSYELGTIGGKPTLLQAPTQNLSTLRDDSRTYQKSWTSFPTGVETLDIQGNMLDISLTFNAAPESKWPSFATVSSAILGKVRAKPNLGSDQASYFRTAAALTGAGNASFGLHLGADLTGDEKTVVGYDLASQTLYLDRTLSGNTTFNKIFPGVYRAPLEPDASGKVDVRVLLDWSSVEVFGGRGEAVLTAQIFPDTQGRQVAIFASGITDGNFHVTVDKLESSWA